MSSGQRVSGTKILAQVKDWQVRQGDDNHKTVSNSFESEHLPLRGSVLHRLPFSDAPMGHQLALSEGMLAAFGEGNGSDYEPTPAFRWYVPRETALVLGNGQPLTAVDAAAASKSQVTVYRRTSGGTAVLVDRALLSLDIALPHNHSLASADVTLAYRWVGEMWARALHTLGIPNAYAIPTARVRAISPLAQDDPLRLACYGALSPWEVVVDDPMTRKPRKLVGLCQVRRRHGALFQTGVYRRLDASRLARLLALPPDARQSLTTRLSAAAIGMADVTPPHTRLSMKRVIQTVERELANVFSAPAEDAEWTAPMLATAERLERERFQPVQF